MDPHKRSATIEVMTADEVTVGRGRFGTDRDGYTTMVRYAQQWPDRVWAIEGCAAHPATWNHHRLVHPLQPQLTPPGTLAGTTISDHLALAWPASDSGNDFAIDDISMVQVP